MSIARETVELLVQASRIWHFERAKHGLRDREWMALRFLARANRFSRTPSALASFVRTTRATASQIVKALEKMGYLARIPSSVDRRSVMLCVTPQGKKLLGNDPINYLVNAVAALDANYQTNFGNTFRQVLDGLETTSYRIDASICRDCMFLVESAVNNGTGKVRTEFTCRFFRSSISVSEIDLLCISFERRRARR
jgi:MarR family transcriptional regulator, negative regulator of the multidrug operon emrRAB